jgi:cellulose biosynthesis protein BcsQ
MTRIITFYSYKGGVGRTMALVNTAHILARDGWRVLMVDFDLEAPEMTHFFADAVRDRPRTVKRDALDLLLHAKRSLESAESDDHPRQIPHSLAEYVVNIKLPNEWIEKGDEGIPYRNGRLDLLPATLEPIETAEAPESEPTHDYVRRMDELDLSAIFAKDGPRHRFGDHVRKYLLNARFRAVGHVVFTMRDHVVAADDIVLIDSRTGLNEI